MRPPFGPKTERSQSPAGLRLIRTMNDAADGWTVSLKRSQLVLVAVQPFTFGAITVPLQVSEGLASEIVPDPGVAAVDDVSGMRSAAAAVAAATTASARRARARSGRWCVTLFPLGWMRRTGRFALISPDSDGSEHGSRLTCQSARSAREGADARVGPSSSMDQRVGFPFARGSRKSIAAAPSSG